MARVATVAALILCLTGTTALNGFAQEDVNRLLNKMVQARGGPDRLNSTATSVMTGKITLVSQGGMVGDITIKHIYPDKTLVEMVFGGTRILQGFDGNTAWSDNPVAGGFSKLSAEETAAMKREAVGYGMLTEPHKYGISYAYSGQETIADTTYHILDQTFDDGFQASLFVDATTNLVRRSKSTRQSAMGTFDEEVYFSDYRETAGVTFPYKVSTFLNGQESIRIVYDRIDCNVELDAAAFEAVENFFPHEQLTADVRQLAGIIEATHPDPYSRIGGKIEFNRRLQHVLHAIPRSGMTSGNLLKLLLPFIAAVGDAHTEIYAARNVNSDMPGGIPLRFRIAEKSLYVAGVPDEQYRDLLGARLVSVEGVTADELCRRLINLRPIDNDYHMLWYLSAVYLWYEPYLKDLLPKWQNAGRITVTLQPVSGEPKRLVFDLPVQIATLSEPDSRIAIPTPDQSGFVYDFLEDDNAVAYLRVDHMKHFRESFEARNSLGLSTTSPEELEAIPSATALFKSMVTRMKEGATKTLIVDLRHNIGGDALMADILMFFLYGKEATLGSRWNDVTRISKTYLESRSAITLDDLNQNRPVPLAVGDYDFSGDYSDRILGDTSSLSQGFRHTPTFLAEWESGSFAAYYCPANVIVLTRPQTFSAGFGIAVRLHRSGAVLVGTPCGQAPNSGGNSIGWTLDNTGITGRVSQSYAINFPADSDRARVLPVDYPVTFERLAAYDFDPNIEVLYALELLPEMESAGK